MWAVIADLMRHPALAGSGEVLTIENISGPLAPGTTWDSKERIKMAGGFTARSEALQVEEPHVLSWRSFPPPIVKGSDDSVPDVTWSFELTPVEAGTRVTHSFRVVEPKVGAGRLKMFYLLTRRATAIKRGMERTLVNLKAAVEGSSRSSAA